MILVRRVLGDVLRQRRLRAERTLRQVAAAARISPGYLSEIERGQKEPSSELVAAICEALDVRLSDVLAELSTELAAAELAAGQVTELPVAAKAPAAKLGTPPTTVVSGGKPGARATTRPAPRPVTKRPVPTVPVAGTAAMPVPAAHGLTTNLPMPIALPPDTPAGGPAGVPIPTPASGGHLIRVGEVFISA